MWTTLGHDLASKCYEQLRAVDDMNDWWSHAKGSRCYEQLRVVDGMNNSRSYELKALYAMNNSRLWTTWTIPVRDLKSLDAMNK